MMIRLAHHYAAQAERRAQALRHPIGRAIALDELERVRRDLQLRVLLLEDGKPCRRQLADAAWVVGLGSELALATGHAETRRVHSTLRGVLQLAQEGALWKTHLALPLDHALAVSHALLLAFPDLVLQRMPCADWLRYRITSKTVDGTEVAGGEIYSTSPPSQENPA